MIERVEIHLLDVERSKAWCLDVLVCVREKALRPYARLSLYRRRRTCSAESANIGYSIWTLCVEFVFFCF